MPAPRSHIQMPNGDVISITPEQVTRLAAQDLIYRCSVCSSGTFHVTLDTSEDLIRSALATPDGEAGAGRVFVPLQSAWH